MKKEKREKERINILRRISTFIQKPIFSALVTLVTLLVAIFALFYSIKTLDNANDQFKQNSKQSEKMFNEQLQNSKSQNENVVSQIKELQQITDAQLIITDEQLRVSKEVLNDQIYAGRPKFIIMNTTILDTNKIVDNLYKPKISIIVKNIGRRFANNYSYRPVLVFPDYSNMRFLNNESDNLEVEPEGSLTENFYPEIPLKFRDRFYLCIELEYYDSYAKSFYHQVYYYAYKSVRNDYQFYVCSNEESTKLKQHINIFLKKFDQPLFDVL